MGKLGIDAYVVADADPHSSEYPAPHWKTRSWLSGFTGSNGTLVVTPGAESHGEARLWTDGRYYIQAEGQLAGSGVTLMRGGEPGVPDYIEWLADISKGKKWKIGVDGKTTSCSAYDALNKALAGENIIVTGHDLISQIWADGRPDVPAGKIFCHDIKYAGKHASAKIDEVRAALRGKGADCALIAGLEDVAWLYNIRGSDMPLLPVVYACAFVSPDSAELYIDREKTDDGVVSYLAGQGIHVRAPGDLQTRLEGLKTGGRICCDPKKTSVELRRYIPDGVEVVYAAEPTIMLKAIKNEAEIRGHREAQIWDGAAMARFMIWIEKKAESGEAFTEWDASKELTRLRALSPESRGDSFNTIAGYGPNGAMMHYGPSESKSALIKNAGFMVVDSGGQYPGGTTDVTRTIVFGRTTPEERSDYTLTLKSHIALASARFLYGAAGSHIDSIARKVMWDHGLDYKCGTGHGIGCYLSVHEGPQSVSMRTQGGERLEPDMIISIEPGVYREGKHGVRIENLVRITDDFTNEFGRFLHFETLTFVPICLEGVEKDMLDGGEREWLNAYHRDVYEKISPLLDGYERAWLKNATRAI